MDIEEFEAARKSRVKELEDLVLRLERENKKLLNTVTDTADKYREEAKENESAKLSHTQSVDDLISLDGDMARANEDEWLYVSPAKPPTPTQKQVTPSQWLMRDGVAMAEDPVFSLDNIRKDLSFQISSAESLSPIPSRKIAAGETSPLTTRRQFSNPTARRYLNQVRERRASPPADEETLTPPRRRPARPDQPHDVGTDDVVPVVRWKRPVVPQDDPPTPPPPEEAVPVIRWKKPVMPTDEPQAPEEAVPVIRWKKPVMPSEEHHSTAEEAVPVVRWKKPVMPSEDTHPTAEEAVPVVRWKKPVMPREDHQAPASDDVPVIRWKRPVVPKEDAQAPVSEDVPVINWKPPRQRNIPAKAITTTARSPPEGEEEEALQDYRGHQSHMLPPASSLQRSAGLRPMGKTALAGSASPQYRHRNLSAERPSHRQAGPASLRSRSPSPSGPGRAHSHSPSVRHSPSTSPQLGESPRAPGAPRKLLPRTPPSQNLQPPNKQGLVKSPSSPGPRKSTPPSSSGSYPQSRAVPPSSSSPLTAGQRRLPPSPGRQVGPPSPSSGQRLSRTPQRQQANSTAPSPGARPRTQNSPQRAPKTQPAPSRPSPGSQIRPARHSTAPSPPRQKHQPRQPPPQKQEYHHDDTWLEGCF